MRKLSLLIAAVQTGIGVLITAVGIYVATYRFPLSWKITQPGGGGFFEIYPGPELVRAIESTYIMVGLGVVTVILGLVQIFRIAMSKRKEEEGN